MDCIQYHSIEGGSGIKSTARGIVTGDALVAATRRFTQSFMPQIAASEFWFSDYSALNGAGVLPEHAREIAEISRELDIAHLILGVHAPRDLEFGMTRLWEALADGAHSQIGVFRNLPDLRDWFREQLGKDVVLGGGELLAEYPTLIA